MCLFVCLFFFFFFGYAISCYSDSECIWVIILFGEQLVIILLAEQLT